MNQLLHTRRLPSSCRRIGMLAGRVGLICLCSLLLAGCADSPSQPAKSSGLDKYTAAVREKKAGDREAAIRDLNDAIRINPQLRMARIVLADVYRTNGDYALAAEQYEIATRLDPYSSSNDYNLGVCYQFLHRLGDAAAAYLQAIKLDPKDMRANMNLGLVYLALGQPKNATDYLRRATEMDPTSAEAWTNFGVGLDARSEYADAAEAYRKALEIDSGSISALTNLATNLISQKKPAEAIPICQQLLLRSDFPLTRTRYGDALTLAKQFDEAKTQYELALKRDKRYYPALSAEGFLLIARYEDGAELDESLKSSALELWKSSLQLSDDQPRVKAAIAKWER